MRTNLVVPEICILGNSIIELLIRMEMKAVYQLRFQAIVVTLHRCVVVWTAGATHALLNSMRFTAEGKVQRRELAALFYTLTKAANSQQRVKFRDVNWLPWSECRTSPCGRVRWASNALWSVLMASSLVIHFPVSLATTLRS